VDKEEEERLWRMTAFIQDLKARGQALLDVMGTKFLLTGVLIEHVLQGFIFGGGADGLVGSPIPFLLRSYGTLSAARIQILKTIAVSPWALKPLFGMVSDTIFIGGYNKMPYVFLTTLFAIISCIFMVFTWPLSPTATILLLFLLFLQISVSDLLLEAKYTQKMTGHTEIGPDLTAFINMGGAACQILSTIVCGVMLTYVPLNYIYLLPIPVLLLTLYPVYKNWLDDTEYTYRESQLQVQDGDCTDASGGVVRSVLIQHNTLCNLCCRTLCWYQQRVGNAPEVPIFGLDTQKVKTHWRVFLLCTMIGGTSILTSTIGLAGLPTLYLFILSLVSAAVMIGGLFGLMPVRQIALIQTYNILQSMCSVSTSGADFFFFTDTKEQYPEGPHFSNFFYVTVMGLVATVLSLLGVLLYQLFMTRWRFRTVLRMSNLMLILFSLPNIIFFNRWNVGIIPDEVFVLGSEALQVVTSTWASMPIGLMMLQLCPKDIEATGYALLAGSSNMGRALSQYMGAYLLEVFNVRPTGALRETHQFDNLWKVALISIFLPLIPLLLINWLIPDKQQTDNLLAPDDVIVT